MRTVQRLALWVAVIFSGVTSCPLAFSAENVSIRAVMPQQHVAVFKKYCFECHDSATEEGSVNLEEIPLEISKDIATAERWQKVLNAINSGEMPPEDSDPISDQDKTSFLEALSRQMVVARKILSDSGGAITMRRLNRREYANTIESLLGVHPDVSNLPDDQAVSGFDTSGASLFFSSDQLEQYLATARDTLELALISRGQKKPNTARIELEEIYTPHYEKEAAKLRDMGERAQAWKDQSEKPPSEFGILDEYQVKKHLEAVKTRLPQIVDYLARPENKTGAALMLSIKEGGYTKVRFPVLQPNQDGKYTIRIRAAAYRETPVRLQYLEFTSGFGTGRNHLGWRKVTGTLDNPQLITFPIKHKPGEKLQVWVHQRTHQDRGDKNLWSIDQQNNGLGTRPGVWIDWAELVGPESDDAAENPALQVLFEKPPAMKEQQYAKEVLRRFASRAFRVEQPSEEFLDRLGNHYLANRAKGENETKALIGPLSIILASPSFLYFVESSSGDDARRLSATELAVRLAYFLWSSPPDDELWEVAHSGKLTEPKVLFAQTSRMLADERSDHFIHGFVHQWLQMERLDMFQFDGVQYPTFDNAVRENAREEIYQNIRLMLTNKLPLGTLLKSDFVVINDVLADYYDLPKVDGHEFRKVMLPKDSIRGGLLGTAAVCAMGSDGQRSSPVERGAWVLRHLINNPPPPAPPNVPQLSRLDGQFLSARDLARAHQEQPQCAQVPSKD